MQKAIFHKLIIVGCGASGMTAALSASLYEKDILIIERNSRGGRKLLATGNGKCNFTNLNVNPSDFRGHDCETAFSVYNRFNCNDTIAFFRSAGIPVYNRNNSGYCYPHSEQASSVRDTLDNLLYIHGVNVCCNTVVRDIHYENGLYTLECDRLDTNDNKDKSGKHIKASVKAEAGSYSCEKLIIAAGGSAQACYGTDGSIYPMLSKLGHNIVNPLPALVGLNISNDLSERLAGVRQQANVSLITDNETGIGDTIYTEYGEIIFSKAGISGIPVMNASRFANESILEGKSVILRLDFFHDMSEDDLREYIASLCSNKGISVRKLLVGLVNDKLLQTILEQVGRDTDRNDFVEKMSILLKCFDIQITGSNGFDSAQCSSGGIPLKEINPETLESTVCHGLYFAGEVLDVDGKCGGYNLQWAWTTGAISGAHAGGGQFDKNQFIKAPLQQT